MITLTCIRDVQMRKTNDITFYKGFDYEFSIASDGSISRYSNETGYHSFSATSWGEWFCVSDVFKQEHGISEEVVS